MARPWRPTTTTITEPRLIGEVSIDPKLNGDRARYVEACKSKGLPPTARGFSKFRRGFGQASGYARDGKLLEDN